MKKNYLNNKEFEQLIKDYIEDPVKYEDTFVISFDLLITNIIKTFNFNVEEDDAKQECFLLILKIIGNFDPSRGTAFNYFTTTIKNQLNLMYTKKKRYQEKLEIYETIKDENSLKF